MLRVQKVDLPAKRFKELRQVKASLFIRITKVRRYQFDDTYNFNAKEQANLAERSVREGEGAATFKLLNKMKLWAEALFLRAKYIPAY